MYHDFSRCGGTIEQLVPPEIALWERVEAGPVITDIEADSHRYRRLLGVASKAGEELIECLEAAAQQRMRVSVLRRAAPVRWSRRERIKFEGPCDAGAEHDGVFAEC
jgi:aspartate oxidase